MAGAGEEGRLEQLSFASDLDLAYQLQLAEAIQASLRSHPPPNAAAASCSSSSSSSQAAAYLDPSSARRQHFRIFSKRMASKEVVGPRARDPGVAVLAVAVCGPQGEVVLRMQKPVEGFVGDRKALEVMALLEGLHAALRLGVRRATIVTDYMLLHNHMRGIWRPTQQVGRHDQSSSVTAKTIRAMRNLTC